MKSLTVVLLVAVGVAAAVMLEPRPFRRRLPADRLRGDRFEKV